MSESEKNLPNSPSLIQTATFKEFEAYEAAIGDVELQLTLPRLECPLWVFRQLNLTGQVHIQISSEGSGVIAEGVTRKDGFVFFLHGSGHCRANGTDLSPPSGFLYPPGTEFCISNNHANDWITVFIPNQLIQSVGLNSGYFPFGETNAGVLHSGKGRVAELWHLVQKFLANTTTEPRLAQEKAASVEFRDSLLSSVSRLHRNSGQFPTAKRGRPAVVDLLVIRPAVEFIEDLSDSTATLTDLMAVTGLSERTLRMGFQKFYGVSPQKYLQLRRLHQAKQLLSDPRQEENTVTKVAAKLGMWDFGRFAERYKRLFGELPSTTLSRVRKPS